ncbi:MAG: hypothetical protein H6611_04310 [Ignavibacteriales bacterium]|nr:hypothetical protein [Ignavibacteriales bacterium]
MKNKRTNADSCRNCKKFGYKNRSTVQQHLQAIEKKGYIKRNSKLSRN